MSKRILRPLFLVALSAMLFRAPQLRAFQNTARRAALSAQDASSFTLDGKITQAESGKLTINTEENILFHVTYGDKTEIKRADGSEGSAKDLKVGARVHVVGDLQESGEIAASSIKLQEQDSKQP
jgi:Domain of unknown function (DUF5666)